VRTQYERPGVPSLHPVDSDLNLPAEKYSLPVRRRVAVTAARTSFDATVEILESTTGARVPKRQAEQLAQRSTQDFEAYYSQTELVVPPEQTAELLVVSTDGKGVVMRLEGLRPATRKAAESTPRKLETRLTSGEKPNRKRMAMVAAVFTIKPWVRTADDVIAGLRRIQLAHQDPLPPRPRPEHKRVWASVERSAEQVIAEAFDEAMSRDPRREKTWVVVVDGLKSQLDRIKRVARRHGAKPIIILDFIHALEYLWKASAVFEHPGPPRRRPGCSSACGACCPARQVRLPPGSVAALRSAVCRRRNVRPPTSAPPICQTTLSTCTTISTWPAACRSRQVSSKGPAAT